MNSLPISLQREVTSYLNYSLPLCSILSEDKNRNWLNSRFLNLYSIDSPEKLWLDFLEPVDFYADVASHHFITAENLTDDFNLLQHIQDCLARGRSLSFFVDSSELLSFSDQSHPLQLWVYGYDEEKQLVFSPGFSGEREFELVQYPVDKIVRAFYALFEKRHEQPIWYRLYCLAEVSVTNYQGSEDTLCDAIRERLNQYAESTVLSNCIRPEFGDVSGTRRFGFDAVCALPSTLLPSDTSCRFIYQTAHLLYEHKKQVHQALCFLGNHSSVNQIAVHKGIEGYKNLVTEYEKFRRILMMGRLRETYWETFYGPLSDDKVINKLKSKLDSLIETEATILHPLTNQL